MNHLALDTVTEILSVSLRVTTPGGSRCLTAVREMGLRHAHLVMPIVDRLLSEAAVAPGDLDLVSCMRGPGSFTGLRIGMATVKGLASAVMALRGLEQAPVVSVSTLDVMAGALAPLDAWVVPVIDGRKGRFYTAVYFRGERLTGDLDLTPAEILARVGDLADAAGAPNAAGAPCHPPASNVPGASSAAPGAGGSRVERELIVTGPHARQFVAEVRSAGHDTGRLRLVVDPGARRGYASILLEYAEAALATHGYDEDDQGPVYVRQSDAELMRHDPGSPGRGHG